MESEEVELRLGIERIYEMVIEDETRISTTFIHHKYLTNGSCCFFLFCAVSSYYYIVLLNTTFIKISVHY